MSHTGKRVVLVGDSTIDNVVWVAGEGDSDGGASKAVAGQLQQLAPMFDVVNYAADGFTTTNVLHGGAPYISCKARREAGDPFPPGSEDSFHPLQALAAVDGATHAVLSIGGNDVREILADMSRIGEALGTFSENYPRIVNRISQSIPQLVLMLQYRPARQHQCASYHVYSAMASLPGSDPPEAKMNRLMERMYAPVLELAREKKLPVVDLPHTFDIHNMELYKLQIEPSEQGGAVIARLIAHILTKHDFSGPSRLYRIDEGGAGDISSRRNEGEWRITIDGELQASARETAPATTSIYKVQLEQLSAMGFRDEEENERLLGRHGGQVDAVVAELLDP